MIQPKPPPWALEHSFWVPEVGSKLPATTTSDGTYLQAPTPSLETGTPNPPQPLTTSKHAAQDPRNCLVTATPLPMTHRLPRDLPTSPTHQVHCFNYQHPSKPPGGSKISLKKFLKIEIVSNIFSDNNGINIKRNFGSYANTQKLNNMHLNDH